MNRHVASQTLTLFGAITYRQHVSLYNKDNEIKCLNAFSFLSHTHHPEIYNTGHKSAQFTKAKLHGKLTRMKLNLKSKRTSEINQTPMLWARRNKPER